MYYEQCCIPELYIRSSFALPAVQPGRLYTGCPVYVFIIRVLLAARMDIAGVSLQNAEWKGLWPFIVFVASKQTRF